MIKVSILYPTTPDARFDHDYYRNSHMPLVQARMGDRCLYYTIDLGIAGGAAGAPSVYEAMSHIFCDTIEAFQAGMAPHMAEIRADVANYTDIVPITQISEVVVGYPKAD